MKRKLSLLLLLVCMALSARNMEKTNYVSFPGGKCYMYRLVLSNKQGSDFKLSAPDKFLSAKALARRKHQNIAIDTTDLPIPRVYLQTISVRGLHIVGTSKWNNTVLVKSRTDDVSTRISGLSFIKKAVRVFSSPDSIKFTRRQSFRTEVTRWDTISCGRYGVANDQVMALGGIRLHNAGYKGKGKLIAVFDGGFMNADRIPALNGGRIVGTADFVEPKAESIYSEVDHGSMVLSIMAADVPDKYEGTAPAATYALVRCEDQYTESLAEEDYWAEAAEYADSLGVDIINSSLGYHDFDDDATSHKYSELDGESSLISHTASMLAGKGIILINSAGNDGMGTWKKINFPADAKDILTVGAVDSNGMNAAFSAVGPTADGRIKPDVMAYGSPTAVINGRGSISHEIGTSFSAPLVCGMVACLWQALPDKTAKEIIALVVRSSSQTATPDNVFGYGIPDFWKAYKMGKGL